MHVVPEQPPFGLSSDPSAVREWRTIELERAHLLLSELAKDAGRTRVAGRRVASGSPAQALRAIARQHGAEYIVVGSHGKGPLAWAVLGSVSGELSRSAPCPVVVVPPRRPSAGSKEPSNRRRDG